MGKDLRKQEIYQLHWLRGGGFMQFEGSLTFLPHSEPHLLGLFFIEVWCGMNFDRNPTSVERTNSMQKIWRIKV